MSEKIPPFPQDDLTSLIRELSASEDAAFRERAWDVHGTAVRLAADHEQLLGGADRLLRVFPAPRRETGGQLRLALTTRRRWVLPPDAKAFPASGHEIIDPREAYGVDARFFRGERMNYYGFLPMGSAAYDLEKGLAVGFLDSPESYRPWLIEHLILQMLLLEMLRGQGLFWLHASCVAHGGKGVLFSGRSGSGKTTSCLNLASRGFGFLGEDRLFVRPEGTGVTLRGFPRDMAVTRETLALLPILRTGANAPAFTSRKLRVPAATLFPDNLVESALPGLILFPKVTGASRTTFRPLPPAQALCGLLPNSLLASHPGVSARHFQALSVLVGASRAYDVELGRDVEALPDLVLEILEGGAAT